MFDMFDVELKLGLHYQQPCLVQWSEITSLFKHFTRICLINMKINMLIVVFMDSGHSDLKRNVKILFDAPIAFDDGHIW